MQTYIDMHCDTLMKAWMTGKRDIYSLKNTMVDVERLRKGGCKAQFFAIFLPPVTLKKYMGPLFPKDDRYVEKCCKIFQNTVVRHADALSQARSLRELEANAAAGKLSGILTVEDGRVLDGKLEKLDWLFEKGVRLISLTWNQENCLGAPNSVNPALMEKGLTPFGKDAVRRMNELGMLVDVSHLSDGGFWEVVNLSNKPFVASHSNCRALNPHPRSMTDEMIHTLADKGGVMGVNFGPEFLTGDPKNKQSRLEGILAQLRHMMDVGGVGCAAIGTDFDGVSGELEIGSADRMPLLFEAMDRVGFTPAEIDAAAEGNVLRILRDVMP